MRNPLGSFIEAVGGLTGLNSKDWEAEHNRFLERKTEELIAVAGVTYAIVKKREGQEAAALETKRFLFDLANREQRQGLKDIQSEIAAALIDKAFESPEELERLIENSQTGTN